MYAEGTGTFPGRRTLARPAGCAEKKSKTEMHAARCALARPLRRLVGRRGTPWAAARASLSLRCPERAESDSQANSQAIGLGLGLLGMLALGVAGSPGSSLESSPATDAGADASPVLARLSLRLKARLGARTLSGEGFAIYSVTDVVGGKAVQGAEGSAPVLAFKTASAVEFSLPSSATLLEPVALLAQRLAASRGPLSMRAVHSEHSDACGLHFVFPDRKGSVLVEKRPGTCPAAARIVVFADDASRDRDGFTDADLDAVAEAYRLAAALRATAARPSHARAVTRRRDGSSRSTGVEHDEPGERSDFRDGDIARLESLGAVVHRPAAPKEQAEGEGLSWSSLAGYEDAKASVEDAVLLGLRHPEAYEAVTSQTREKEESNRPRAVLFAGPPGTGKTTAARIIAHQAGVPLVYVPVECIANKYYGESESRMSDILKLSSDIGPSIVFVDEIDSLATSRGGELHEASRKVLGVLLRSLEGFQKNSQSILVAATNRAGDLDAALLSRFDLVVDFPLPGEDTRDRIFRRFAKQLGASESRALAARAEGFAGRDIKDVCTNAERRWVGTCLRAGGCGSQLERREKKSRRPVRGSGFARRHRAAAARVLPQRARAAARSSGHPGLVLKSLVLGYPGKS